MWTKLIYISMSQAFRPQKIGGVWSRPPISGRYKAGLKKEFIKQGVPWLYDPIKPDLNPRHKKPKGHRSEKAKVVRLDKIKKLIVSNVEAERQHLQEHMNKRKLKGIDKFVIDTISPWLSNRDTNVSTKADKARLSMIQQLKGGKKEDEQQSEIE